MLTFGGALMNLDAVLHAPIAIISQSGALAGAIGNSLQGAGIGCSYIVSVGNETCLDALDVLEWIIEQDDVRVVGLYVEGLANAARILPIAERGRSVASRSSFSRRVDPRSGSKRRPRIQARSHPPTPCTTTCSSRLASSP